MLTIIFQSPLTDLVKTKNILGVKSLPDKIIINYQLTRRASIKDIVEALGVPHTEVGEIEDSCGRIDFNYIAKKGSIIKVKPHKIPFNPQNYLFLEPVKKYKFIIDVNVGRLTKFLRLLGFDCAYNPMWDDEKIAEISHKEKRIVLTKDVQLLKRKKILWGKLIKSIDTIGQLKEVVDFFGLSSKDYSKSIFTRCLLCNEILIEVQKQKIIHRLEPKTKKYFNKFFLCPTCDKIYWAGSHVDNMKNVLKILNLKL